MVHPVSFITPAVRAKTVRRASEARGVAEKQWASITEAHCEMNKKSLFLFLERAARGASLAQIFFKLI